MDEEQTVEEVVWKDEEMLKGVYDDIDRAIRDRTYDETCTKAWSDQICETVMKRLKEKWRSFKFMVTCAMMQKNNSTMHAATSCWWEPDSDKTLTCVWPRKDHRLDSGMCCVVTIFAVGF
ncbi:hypothetical protein FOZ62_031935 [Perkinsus olseni]|uniref:Dynein light chain Tctex-type 3 n=1 Tax=Perkinsus olseni TaxID=32597 RepID=A0A7J6QXF2_PEROL|nr:hypothetical protein FOZ62_031935 [Perkinsus olseni]